MGLYEVVLRGSYFGQTCINRWNYLSSGTPGTALPAFGLAEKFGITLTSDLFETGSILRNLQGNISVGYKFVSLQVKNIYDPADFYEAFFPGTVEGEVDASDGLAPFNAVGFVSTQVTLAIAKGHKRFAGLTEGQVDTGGVLSTAAQTAFDALATAMSVVLSYTGSGAALAFAPTVVGKEKYESNPVKHLFSYRFYPTEAVQLEHIASPVVWGLMIDARSQTSRQYGSGS